jgi:DNA replication protein DnaC
MSYDIFVEMVHDARNNDGELPEMYGDPNLLKYMRRVYDVVVFDNLNTDRLTEYMAKTVSNMIESRYEMKLPTIFTTDIIPDKLSVIYSARVQSIIKESCYMMHVVGEDYRTRS